MPALLCKVDDEDMMRLHQVARKGAAEIVARLIRSGVSPNLSNKYGCTALHLACKRGHIAVLRVLSECQNLSLTAWHGRYPLHNAVLCGDSEVVRELLYILGRRDAQAVNQVDETETEQLGSMVFLHPCTGMTALHYAVALRNQDVVSCLLDGGASLLSRDRYGKTPLMYAAECGDTDILRMLLNSRGQNHLPVQDKKGCSVLHLALQGEQSEVLDIVVEAVGCESTDTLSMMLVAEDSRKDCPLLLLVGQFRLDLLKQLLPSVDPFVFQQLRFHDSKTIIADRLVFPVPGSENAHTYEYDDRKEAVIKLLQEKLDDCAGARASHKPDLTTLPLK